MKFIVFLLFVALVAVNANNDLPKCVQDLKNQIEQGKVCKAGDTDCIASLKSFTDCVGSCAEKIKTQQEGIQCLQSECQTSNPSVQSFKNDMIKCANYSLITVFSVLFALIYIMV
ncbi:transmembrane protein, putative (macronuclear) [Tetrahymena thermophila SB210]|uniref:Transmembrane protein, putative n=1 Tax=Tetrahymena thermophila (strain SB210) TaxID=312017 RepID=Q23HB3_TETTS|nr:transmembrane protein, putative [Tetrahymena thermophila SB210]EAR95895.1 transmembrane protein, putative [Tetrahymena thermophila SB210]|eukprot:XP_001016140.1 transmembrane protein, putative [Tetrahymena thermophila SB210]